MNYSGYFVDKDGNKYYSGIVESGSNSNGSYIKFSDGTMICRGTFTIPANTNEFILQLPKSFENTGFQISITNVFSNSPFVLYSCGIGQKDKIEIYARDVTIQSYPTTTSQAKYIAVGKWK